MNLLLDTHIAIWAMALPHRILPAERDLIMDRDTRIFVSAVRIWEIAIKRALGRGDLPAFSAEEAIRVS